MAVQVEFLESIPYFSGLSPTELDSISKLFFEKGAEKGEVIMLEGEPAETLYFVVSGVVKVFKTSVEGKEQILNIVRPGGSFNDVSIFDSEPSPAAAQAMGPVILYGIGKEDLAAILRDYPQVARNTIKVLAEQLRRLMSLVEDLSFKNVTSRVAKILLEHAGDGAGTNPRLTHQEMASMAGTVREVVGRSLKALEEVGIIRLDRHRIVVTDMKALKAMVKSAY